MKVKLIIVDVFSGADIHRPPEYFITEGRLSYWKYSPDSSGISCPARKRSDGWDILDMDIASMGIRDGMPQPISTKAPNCSR